MPADFQTFVTTHTWIFILAMIWTLPWKGVALWRAARSQSVVWFVILLIINTLGILEIVYIFIFSRKKLEPQAIGEQRVSQFERKILSIKTDPKEPNRRVDEIKIPS